MASFQLIILVCLVASSIAGHLSFSDCSHSPNKLFHIDTAHINPDPIHIPGILTGDLAFHVFNNVSDHRYTMDVQIHKHVLFWIPIPCVNNIGTCSYDICDMLTPFTYPNGTTHCPLEVTSTTPDFRCSCPFTTGVYRLNPTHFKIPAIAAAWSFLTNGDYKLDAKILDKETNQEVACYTATLTIEGDCKGFGCIFG